MKIYPRFIEIVEGVSVYKVTISNQSHDGTILLFQIKRSEVKVVSYQPKKGYVEPGKNQDIEITITDPNFARTRLQVKLVAIQRSQIVEDFSMCWEIGMKRSGLVKKLVDIHNNRYDALNSHSDARAPANSPANSDYIQFRLAGGQSGNTSSFQARNPTHLTPHQQLELNFHSNLRTVSKGSYDEQDDAISALSNNHSPTFPASPRDRSPSGRRKGYDYHHESNASVIDFGSAQKMHPHSGDHRHSTTSLDSVASSLYFSPSSPNEGPHGDSTPNMRHLMETSPIKRINYDTVPVSAASAGSANAHGREDSSAALNHSLHSQDHADNLNILHMLSRLNHTGTLDSHYANAAMNRAGVGSTHDFHPHNRMNLNQDRHDPSAAVDPSTLLAAMTNLILSSQQQQQQNANMHNSHNSSGGLNTSSRNDVTSTVDLEPKIDADQCSRLVPNHSASSAGSTSGTSYILELYSDYITVDNVTAIIEYRLHQAYSYSYRINAIQFSNNRTISNLNQLLGSLFAPTEVSGISAAEMAMENQISSMMKIILEDNLQSITINSCQSLLTVSSLTLNKYTKITSLNLSYNNIKSIDSLLELVHLKYLNLSFNNLKSLDYLQSLVKLKVLDVSHNKITSLMLSINMLVSLSDTLLHLDMTDNPVCNDARYVQEVITVMPRLRYFDTVDLLALTPGSTCRSRSAVKCTANRSFIARVRRVLNTKSHQNIVNNRRVGGIISDSSANNSDRDFDDDEDEDDLFQYLDSNRGGGGVGPVAAALAGERNLLNTSQIKSSVTNQQHQQTPQYVQPKTSTLQPFPGDNRGSSAAASSNAKPQQSYPAASTAPPARSNSANTSASSNRSINRGTTGVSGGVNKKKLYENLHATHTATSVQKRRSQIAHKMVELIPDWNNHRAHAAAEAAAVPTPRFVAADHQKKTIWELHNNKSDLNISSHSGLVVNNSVLNTSASSAGPHATSRQSAASPARSTASEQRASDRRRSLASHNGGYHSEGHEGFSPHRTRRGSSSHKPISMASFEVGDSGEYYHSEGEIDRRKSRSYMEVDDEKFEQMQEDERYGIYHPRYRVPAPNLGYSHHIFSHTKAPKMRKKAPLYDETVQRIRDGFEKLPTRGTFTRAPKGLTADWYPMDRDTIEAIRRQGFFHQAIGDRLEFSYRDFNNKKSRSLNLNESISARGDTYVTQANGSVMMSPTKKGRRGSVGQHQSRIWKPDEATPSFDPNSSVLSYQSHHSHHSQHGQPSTAVNHLHPTTGKEDDFSGYRKWHSGRRVSISPAFSDGYRSRSESPTMFQQHYHDHGSLDEVHQQQQHSGHAYTLEELRRSASPSPGRSGIPKPKPNQNHVNVSKSSGSGDVSPRYEQQPHQQQQPQSQPQPQPATLLPVSDGKTAVMSPIAKLFNIVDSYGNNSTSSNSSVNVSEDSRHSSLPLLPAERGSGSLYSEYMASRRSMETEATPKSPGEEEKKMANYMNWLDTTHEQLRR